MYDWPTEPLAPEVVDDGRFGAALAVLCGPKSDPEVRSWYAGWITAYAREFGSDPFLLGALIAYRSGCHRAGGPHGVGLTGLVTELYDDLARDGRYQYDAWRDGAWVRRSLDISKFPYEPRFVSSPEANVYFSAAFLRAWREQQRGLFISFVQHEYRHSVSHFVWGDIVKSNRNEDSILVLRRRLLAYYEGEPATRTVRFADVDLGCPLDGCPRLITSTLGDAREGGKRAHRGVDFESLAGEPVRAAAPGRVEFAGADLPGKTAHARLPIYAHADVAKSLFGAGGIYVCIRHSQRVMTCYMHLQEARVEQGRLVKRGDLIGNVGKTGVQQSGPHLHFEVHLDGGVVAATEAMPGLVVGRPRNTPLSPVDGASAPRAATP